MSLNSNKISRRGFVAMLTAGAAVMALPKGAFAITTARAKALIDQAAAEINAIISSGKSQAAMNRDFERVLAKYGDVPTMARSALGPTARSASAAQMRSFTQAFQGYLAAKYGKRFGEFQGGQIDVRDARPLKSFYEVRATARLRGQSPFAVSFMVSDRSGKDLFFDMVIEGISLLKSERTEIGGMLDKRGGNLDAVIRDLQAVS